MVITTTVTVELSYILKSGVTGDVIWEDKQSRTFTPQNATGGHPIAMLVGMLINAALAKAAPNYMPLAHQANAVAFKYPEAGFPQGSY